MEKKTKVPTSWSFSKLGDYQQCPRLYKHAHVDKLPQPESDAMAEGHRIHKVMEDYLSARAPEPTFPRELRKLKSLIEMLRDLHPDVEEGWGFDVNMQPCGWSDWDSCWLRVKLDAFVMYDDGDAEAIDLKTGKLYGKYDDQMALYAYSVFQKYPYEVTGTVTTRLWFSKQGDEVMRDWTRDEAEKAFHDMSLDAKEMLADRTWEPQPSFKCKWCAYGRSKGGPCNAEMV